jgi:hypothetical protein
LYEQHSAHYLSLIRVIHNTQFTVTNQKREKP